MASVNASGAGIPERADAEPGDGRFETRDERMDRNWADILQELRVTQTGTQVLTGFLLAIAFQPAFARLDAFQRGTYLALISAAVLSTAIGLAPVALHRGLFRQHVKDEVVSIAHRLLYANLVGVGLVLTGSVLLVFDVVVSRVPAVIAASVMAAVVLACGLLPLALRRHEAGTRVRSAPSR